MTVCMYRDTHTTTLYYWPHTTGMPHLKTTISFSERAVCHSLSALMLIN